MLAVVDTNLRHNSLSLANAGAASPSTSAVERRSFFMARGSLVGDVDAGLIAGVQASGPDDLVVTVEDQGASRVPATLAEPTTT